MIIVRLKLEFENDKVAEAIYKSLIPDDTGYPSCLSVSSRIEGSILEYVFVFRGSPNEIWTLRNSIDEILSLVKAVERSLKALEV